MLRWLCFFGALALVAAGAVCFYNGGPPSIPGDWVPSFGTPSQSGVPDDSGTPV
jgi:hypothetical protein